MPEQSPEDRCHKCHERLQYSRHHYPDQSQNGHRQARPNMHTGYRPERHRHLPPAPLRNSVFLLPFPVCSSQKLIIPYGIPSRLSFAYAAISSRTSCVAFFRRSSAKQGYSSQGSKEQIFESQPTATAFKVCPSSALITIAACPLRHP